MVHCIIEQIRYRYQQWFSTSARRVTGYPRVPAGTRGSGRDGCCFRETDKERPGNIFSRILILPGGCIQQTVYIKVLVLAMQVFICQTCVSILDLKIMDV